MLVSGIHYSGLSVAHWIFILSAEYCVWYCIVSVWGRQRRTLSLLSKKLFPSPPPKAYLSHQVILTTIAIAHTSHSADQNGQNRIQSNNTLMHIISKQNKQESSTFFHQIIQWHVYQVYLVFLHMKKLHLAAILKLAVKSSFLKMISFPKGGEHSFCPQPLFLEWWRHCFTLPCLFICLDQINLP